MTTLCQWKGKWYYLESVRGKMAKIQSMYGCEFIQRRWFKKTYVKYKRVRFSDILFITQTDKVL